MRSRSLLLGGLLSLTLSAALAQSQPGPAYFLRQSTAKQSEFTAPLLTGLPATPPVAAPLPTVRAAAALPTATGQPAVTDAAAPTARHYLTAAPPAPAYDLYQNWPEAQRRATLPAPYAEPLPVQLLRGVLGR